MRILICDDDTLIIEQLKKYIESYFESNHLKCPELVSFTSGEALLTDKGEKDIVFLDIEMPGMNGIYVGNELKKANRNVIVFVVTSYSEYLDEAMRFHVFRYLSKPLDKQRFFRNLKDALAYYNSIIFSVKETPIQARCAGFRGSRRNSAPVRARYTGKAMDKSLLLCYTNPRLCLIGRKYVPAA